MCVCVVGVRLVWRSITVAFRWRDWTLRCPSIPLIVVLPVATRFRVCRGEVSVYPLLFNYPGGFPCEGTPIDGCNPS